MSDEIEAMGTLAMAGAVAHTIDHDRGMKGEAHDACLNCGTPLDGRFCRECGQPAHVHRTLGHVFEEFLHGLLHVDTKAWRTLPMLVFRPGRLTREYVHGRRARYIAPFALFLFTIFLMFFVFGFVGSPQLGQKLLSSETKAEKVAEARKELTDAQQELRQVETELAAAMKNANAEPGEVGGLKAKVAATRMVVDIARDALERAQAGPEEEPGVRRSDSSWQDDVRAAVQSGRLKVDLEDPELNERARKALLNPDLTLYKVQQKAYKLSFLLVPMSLPFLWLLFAFRRDVTLYDHTVFALYSLSFMSLLFVTIALLFKAGSWGSQIGSLLLFVPPIHMYAQLQGAYSLGRLGALWRTWWLLVFSAIVLAIYVAFILLLGLID